MSSPTNTTVDADGDPGNGITAGYGGNNVIILQSMTAFSAIAWYNSIELLTLIFLVFKKYEGVYFYSILITTLSVIPYQYGAWAKQVDTVYYVPDLLPVAFLNISWMVMIPGQSIVLWSRLHLICQNYKLLKFILWLIIVDAFVFMIPTTVLTWGSNTKLGPFVQGYTVMEKIQMVAFTMQEIFISLVYLWQVRQILRVAFEDGARKVMWELGAVNVLIILMDVALLVVEFNNLYQIETTMKGMVYSIKLKLEFGVLSKLVKVVVSRKTSNGRFAYSERSGETAYHLEDINADLNMPSMLGGKEKANWKGIRWSSIVPNTLYKSDHLLVPGPDTSTRDWPGRSTSEPNQEPLQTDRRMSTRPNVPQRLSVSSLDDDVPNLSYPGRATV